VKRNSLDSFNSALNTVSSDNDIETDNPEDDPELQALAARLEETAPECVIDLELRESLRSSLLSQLRECRIAD
jgi:hypothetical protein